MYPYDPLHLSDNWASAVPGGTETQQPFPPHVGFFGVLVGEEISSDADNFVQIGY